MIKGAALIKTKSGYMTDTHAVIREWLQGDGEPELVDVHTSGIVEIFKDLNLLDALDAAVVADNELAIKLKHYMNTLPVIDGQQWVDFVPNLPAAIPDEAKDKMIALAYRKRNRCQVAGFNFDILQMQFDIVEARKNG